MEKVFASFPCVQPVFCRASGLQCTICWYVHAVPGFEVGPFNGGIAPEGIGGWKAQGQETGGAEVGAPGVDVGLGHVDLRAGEAYPQPALRVEVRFGLELPADDRRQGATDLRWCELGWQLM